MAIDYAEKEREFVSELKADTGRDLNEWMQVISDAGFPHRNDIIDWLRGLGFTFANASWLERIHANGGRLIYAEDTSENQHDHPPIPKDGLPERAPGFPKQMRNSNSANKPTVAPDTSAKILAFTPPRRIAQRAEPQATTPLEPGTTEALQNPPLQSRANTVMPQPLPADIEKLIASAKGLRPLALLTIKEIIRIIPDARMEADGSLIVLSAPRPFLALLTGPKSLRLYGDFAAIDDSRTLRAETQMKASGKPPPPFPTVLPLEDARLIDATFTEMVKTAARRAHS